MIDDFLNSYEDLVGVKGGKLKGPTATSISDILNSLKRHRIVSSAGDHGAISIWKMDDGRFRCGFYRFHNAIDEQSLDYKYQVKAWLLEWFPKQMKFG